MNPVERTKPGVMIMNGREYRQTVGGVYRLHKPGDENMKKENTSTSSVKLTNEEKQLFAAEIIKGLKLKNFSAADRSKILATAYTQALKEKKG